MTVLALDTSSRREVVCLAASEAGELIDAVRGPGDAVAAVVGPAIGRLLRFEPSAVVAVRGPGSYTGVRAGLAAAVGVALARALPLHSVGTLEVVAAGVPQNTGWGTLLAPAGRGAFYTAPLTLDVSSPRAVRRVTSDDVASLPSPLVACEPLEVSGLTVIDRAAALAAAVPNALASPSLPLDGVRAVHIA